MLVFVPEKFLKLGKELCGIDGFVYDGELRNVHPRDGKLIHIYGFSFTGIAAIFCILLIFAAFIGRNKIPHGLSPVIPGGIGLGPAATAHKCEREKQTSG
jgi:hypothetical protein